MLIPQTEKLYLEMTAKLHAKNNDVLSNLLRLSSSLEIIENNIIYLSRLVAQLGFSSDAEEVFFFKHVKPKFYSWKILMVEQFNIVSNIPVDTEESIREYYLRELDFVRRYFEQNQFLYQYYIKDESALDEEYFLRRNRQKIIPSVHVDAFETKGDYTFAKFRACDQLRDFLLTRIRLIYTNPESSIMQILSKNSQLKWTDEKIKLVELAYGVYFMGSLNNGKADISQIVDLLERTLNVDLGVAYRKFIDISRRKNKGFTVYLDGMREAIHEHISSKDNFNKFKRP